MLNGLCLKRRPALSSPLPQICACDASVLFEACREMEALTDIVLNELTVPARPEAKGNFIRGVVFRLNCDSTEKDGSCLLGSS